MSEEQKDGRQLSKQEKWEDKLLKRQKRKLEMAQRENTDFVSTRVADTTDFVRLISTADFLLDVLRKSLGRKGRIDGIKAVQYIARIEAIKDELNQWNAEVSRDLKTNYRPPYGYENPLKEEKERRMESRALNVFDPIRPP